VFWVIVVGEGEGVVRVKPAVVSVSSRGGESWDEFEGGGFRHVG